MPDRFGHARRGDLSGPLLAAVEKAIGGSLLLYGPTGRGKTHAAAAWFHEMVQIDADYKAVYSPTIRSDLGPWHLGDQWTADALWLNVPRWLLGLRARVGAGEGIEAPIDDAAKAWALVLDDLGAEKATDWTAETLYILVSEREGRRLPTVVTTNLSLSELNAWHPRLASRLVGFGRVAVEGDDRRLTTTPQESP